MRFFIDYCPSDNFFLENNHHEFYKIRPVVQLRELRDVVMCCSDELTCTTLTNFVERLLNHKDVVFVGNPSVFDKIPVTRSGIVLNNILSVTFEFDHTEKQFMERMNFESENGDFIIMVREVTATGREVSFGYHYERRDRLGLDGAIRRALIDELLEEL